MNEDNLPTNTPMTGQYAATDVEATKPKSATTSRISRKKAPTSKLPGSLSPQKETLSPEPLGNQVSTEQDDWADYLLYQSQCLLQSKQAEVAQRQAELAQRQVEAELLRRLIEAVHHRPNRPSVPPDLTPQLEQAQQQVAGLQSANAQLQVQWEKAKQDLANATEILSSLRIEGEKLRDELEGEKAARLAEQKQFKEQIEREINYEIEGFKGKLAGKLKPILDQKNTTDDQPADAELADFLRGWFRDLEEKLVEAGIQVSWRK